LNISNVKFGMSFDFPDYEIKLSGLKFQMEFNYTVDTASVPTLYHAIFLVSDMSLTFDGKKSINESVVAINQATV
jgi:hypothetical protein